ncbi:ubiquitin-like protein ISG15 [Plectropomus leopardus]|uniref:ubiquitin-like protein ISG15 n=1 Tax=Plectropomus leopardus TaxID=160734 RepID=UPI001C4AD1E3|nr:ubiquitin-like protein ISG15 [Plectropomus leopardus]
MDITVVKLDGTSHTLRVLPGDTVGSLKQRIQEKFGVPCESQKLMFVNGQNIHLNNDLMQVSSYGLHNGARVSLLVIQPPTIQVFVRNEKGKTNTYDVKSDETVNNLKSRVQSREGVPVSQQRLIHQSREMLDGKLSDYGVVANSTIDLSLRLRGG